MTDPNHGTTKPQEDGVLYTPNADWCGRDWFSYTVADMNGVPDANGLVSDTATVYIDVLCEEPVLIDSIATGTVILTDDVAKTTPNTSVSISVLGNDNVPSGENKLITLMFNNNCHPSF